MRMGALNRVHLKRSCENRREPAGSLIAPVGALQPPIPFFHHGNEQIGQQPYPHSYVIEPWRGMCRQIVAGKFQCPGLGPTPPSDHIPLERRCAFGGWIPQRQNCARRSGI